MEILKLVSIAFSFIGSVFLGTGLIRSKRQIKDESGTYYGYNPYKLEALFAERKLVIPGFIFLLAGFAFQFAAEFTFFPKNSRVFDAVMLGTAITSIGVIAFMVYTRTRENAAEKIHEQKQRDSLKGTLKVYRDDSWPLDHAESLDGWLQPRLNTLRNFKGDLSDELWLQLNENLIYKLEAEVSKKNPQRVKQLLSDWISRNLE